MIATIIKQPGETLRPAVAFSGSASIVAIRGVTVTARGLVPGAAALVASAALAGGVVTLALSGGSDGERYAVTVRAEDLGNSITEDWGPDFAAAGPERSGGAGVYALIHQTGGEIRPREKKALSFGGRIVAKVIIPARPYVGFTDVNADYAIGSLARHLGFGAAA